MRLATRYFLVLGGFAAAGFAAFALLEAIPNFAEDVEQASRLQRAEARGAARRIDSFLESIEAQLHAVNKLPWHSTLLSLEDEREEFHRLMNLNPAIFELTAIASDGRERLYVSRTNLDRMASGRDGTSTAAFVYDATQLASYGNAHFREGSKPYVSVTVRESGAETDAIVAEVDLSFVADAIGRIKVGHAGRAYIVDQNDRLVAHPDLSLVHQKLSLSGFPQIAAARASLAKSNGESVSVRGESLRERYPVLVSATPIAATGWLLFVEQPTDEVMAPGRATLYRTVGLLVLLLIASAGISAIVAKRLTRPIIALHRGATTIREGNLSTRVAVHTGDEIEALGDEFNRMTERLETSYKDLETRVEARTRDLARTTAALETQARTVENLNAQLTQRLGELQVKKEEAEHANLAKTRFLAAASHDLRQPMHTVSLLAGILRERLHDHAASDLVGKVELSVQAMENLFNSLLDISKLDAGAIRPNLVDFNIGSLLALIEANYAAEAQEKGLRLRVVQSREFVRSDPVLLEQILRNLVSNAIRYANRGRIVVGCHRLGDRVRLIVHDQGIGIPAEHLDDIFEEFVQLENAERDRSKGLGLGLSIVKRTADLLGSPVAVKSTLGRGSTFSVDVPAAASPTQAKIPDRQTAPTSRRLEGMFVVIIDDDRDNLAVMQALCAQWGCHVVAAASADDAIARLADHLRTPDLVVTDYRLRDHRTGLSALKSIREYAAAAVPGVIVTGDISAPRAIDEASTGVCVLRKPVNSDRLREAMEAALQTTALPG